MHWPHLITLAAALSTAMAGVPRALADSADRAPAIASSELESGVRVVVKRVPRAQVVAIRAIWPGGIDREQENQAGIATLVARAITRGCGDRSAIEQARAVDAAGGVMSGFAGTSTAGIAAEFMAAAWARGFDLVASCVLSPRFEKNVVARERRRLLAEVARGERDPATVAFHTFVEMLYPGEPHRLGARPTRHTVAALDAGALTRFHRRHHPPAAVTLVVVGNVDPARVFARARARFGRLHPAKTRPADSGRAARSEGKGEPAREVYRYLEADRAHVIIGYQGLAFTDPDRPALEVLVAVVNERLAKQAGARPGLAYKVGAVSREGLAPGFVAAYASCPPARVSEAAALLRATLLHIADDGASGEEVARAKRYLFGTYSLARWRSAAQAAALGYRAVHGLGLAGTLRYPSRVRDVSPAQLRQVARKVFAGAPVTITVMPQTMSPGADRRTNGPRRRGGES